MVCSNVRVGSIARLVGATSHLFISRGCKRHTVSLPSKNRCLFLQRNSNSNILVHVGWQYDTTYRHPVRAKSTSCLITTLISMMNCTFMSCGICSIEHWGSWFERYTDQSCVEHLHHIGVHHSSSLEWRFPVYRAALWSRPRLFSSLSD